MYVKIVLKFHGVTQSPWDSGKH